MSTITETHITLIAEDYVQHGLQGRHFAGTCEEWANEFTRLGGESASVYPSWRITGEVGDLVAVVTGDDAALEFVLGNL